METELIEKNAVIDFLLKYRTNNINDARYNQLFLRITLKKQNTHKHHRQSRKKRDKTHEKVQDSQHDLRNQMVLVIRDAMFNGILEKG